jgi:hypothetical protein
LFSANTLAVAGLRLWKQFGGRVVYVCHFASQNLGMPLTAVTNITKGSIVSLSSSGGAMQGFGMSLSAPTASAAVLNNPILLNMTGTGVVLVYNDTSDFGQAVFYDSVAGTVGVLRSLR